MLRFFKVLRRPTECMQGARMRVRTAWDAAQAGRHRCAASGAAPAGGRATRSSSGARRAAAVELLPTAPMGTMLPLSTLTGTSSVRPACGAQPHVGSRVFQSHSERVSLGRLQTAHLHQRVSRG